MRISFVHSGVAAATQGHSDPIEVEAEYWRWVVFHQARWATKNPGKVGELIIDPEGSDLVRPARLRLEVLPPGAKRELEDTRWQALWARPAEVGRWPEVTSTEIRGLIRAARWSQLELARQLGTAPRTVRRWCAAQGQEQGGIAWPDWFAARSLAADAIHAACAMAAADANAPNN